MHLFVSILGKPKFLRIAELGVGLKKELADLIGHFGAAGELTNKEHVLHAVYTHLFRSLLLEIY